MNETHKLALVIPTMNRPASLVRLLESLTRQTVRVDQIIIVDGSDQSIEPEISKHLYTDYIRFFPPSLLQQKEAGTKAIKENITLVGYLDDDIVVEEDAIEVMLNFWEDCPSDVGGSSFNIINNSSIRTNWRSKLYGKLFYLYNGRRGAVLRSGVNLPLFPIWKDTYVGWLCGGATVWRRKVQETIEHDSWFINHSYIEDVDYSLRVNRKWKLVMLRDARVQHLQDTANMGFARGKAQTIERHHLAKNHNELSAPIFYWSTLGRIGGLIYGGIGARSRSSISMALGHIVGLLAIWVKRNGNSYREEIAKKPCLVRDN